MISSLNPFGPFRKHARTRAHSLTWQSSELNRSELCQLLQIHCILESCPFIDASNHLSCIDLTVRAVGGVAEAKFASAHDKMAGAVMLGSSGGPALQQTGVCLLCSVAETASGNGGSGGSDGPRAIISEMLALLWR